MGFIFSKVQGSEFRVQGCAFSDSVYSEIQNYALLSYVLLILLNPQSAIRNLKL